MPDPSKLRPRAPSTRWKRSNRFSDLGRRNADAGVAHRQPRRATEFAQRHADLALEGELERVGEQVENDLLPHVAIDIGGLTERRASTVRRSPALSVADRKTLPDRR